MRVTGLAVMTRLRRLTYGHRITKYPSPDKRERWQRQARLSPYVAIDTARPSGGIRKRRMGKTWDCRLGASSPIGKSASASARRIWGETEEESAKRISGACSTQAQATGMAYQQSTHGKSCQQFLPSKTSDPCRPL